MLSKGFSFPDIAKNEFAQANIQEVENYQMNLNHDLDSKILLENFIAKTNEVK